MDFSIYRIFPALGDSIMLATLFKEKGITRVFYNRAELGVLKKVIKIYDIQPIEFIYETRPIDYTMVTVSHDMHKENIKLIKPTDITVAEQKYITYQLGSHNETASDRDITEKEMKKHITYPEMDLINTQELKYVTGPLIDVFNLISSSAQHITCDSGTAFVATSLGIKTTIISKNSFYWPASWFNMQFFNSHENVTVYQEDELGVRIPNEIEYIHACSKNNARVPSYQHYIHTLKNNPK